jgi:hypothetical protein
MQSETQNHFVLAGLAWAEVEAAGRAWSIPDGEIKWIGWPVEDYPAMWVPGGITTEYRADAGRCSITVSLPPAEASVRATAVADAISGMSASPYSPFPVDPTVLPISAADIDAQVVDAEALRGRIEAFHDPLLIDSLIRDVTWRPGFLDPVLDRVDVVIRDGDGEITGLLPAYVFWRLAVDEFAFAPHDVRDLFLEEPAARPTSRLEQARVEASIQNAFKALEALLGGWPPNDRGKLARLLNSLGLQPHENVTVGGETTSSLLERFFELRDVRSKQAAHAGRTGITDRSLTWRQLLDAHITVWHCLYHRTEHLLAETRASANQGTPPPT